MSRSTSGIWQSQKCWDWKQRLWAGCFRGSLHLGTLDCQNIQSTKIIWIVSSIKMPHVFMFPGQRLAQQRDQINKATRGTIVTNSINLTQHCDGINSIYYETTLFNSVKRVIPRCLVTPHNPDHEPTNNPIWIFIWIFMLIYHPNAFCGSNSEVCTVSCDLCVNWIFLCYVSHHCDLLSSFKLIKVCFDLNFLRSQ